jgi:hypothetical protein
MPYVPSKKTKPSATDREILDAALEPVAQEIAAHVRENFDVIEEYKRVFCAIADTLSQRRNSQADNAATKLAHVIYDVGAAYKYEGAFLGELNYTITRLIQRVPQIMVKSGKWKDELRYWLYAATVEALIYTSIETRDRGVGVSGVFEDIKDEYKVRVNRAYEDVQIAKSGDCYDTPYYGRILSGVDEDNGEHVGYFELRLDRSKVPPAERNDPDVLSYVIPLKKIKRGKKS